MQVRHLNGGNRNNNTSRLRSISRIYVPVRAEYNIEHEREGGAEEIEFQIKWTHE